MMKPVHFAIATALLAGLLLLVPFTAQAERAYISITEPSLRKIPLALPPFQTPDGDAAAAEAATEMAGLLVHYLDFTGYFKMVDPGAFLVDTRSPDFDVANVRFRNWTTVGAELLITGLISLEGEFVRSELRLYDTVKESTLVGKRYTGHASDQRSIVLRFAGEVIEALTGRPGLFNSRIAFVSNGSGNKEIYTCDFDGSNPKPFTHHKSITLSPAWSGDMQWLAYTSYYQGNPDLYIRSLAENKGFIVNFKGTNITPAWHPARPELAASLSHEGDPEIYMLTATGKIIKKLTRNWGIDVSPSWSPKGDKIAYVSNRSGSPQIYIHDLDTGEDRRLTFEGQYNTNPSWSPAGDKIAFAALEGGQFDIYTIGADGRGLARLTRGQGDNESPCWSPDGSLIAFASNRTGPYRIYVMTAYGTDQRQLLTLPGEQTDPKWSPNAK